jgi:DNA-binding transcriptional regulator GbsR (MarR family)
MEQVKAMLTEPQRRFIEDFAALFASKEIPAAQAQIFGLLLICGRAVSLDEIAADLGLSKSSASVAAGHLEGRSMVRRLREPGSKRALYDASPNFDAVIARQHTLLAQLAAQMDRGIEVAASEEARARFRDMGSFYSQLHTTMSAALEQWMAERRASTEAPVAEAAREKGAKVSRLTPSRT